jgi:hypothetical protein
MTTSRLASALSRLALHHSLWLKPKRRCSSLAFLTTLVLLLLLMATWWPLLKGTLASA